MGPAFWLVSAIVAFLIARLVPLSRPARGWREFLAAAASALLLGVTATALDFGGWDEPDWRAGLFILFGTLALLGLGRIVATLRSVPSG